jgi:hypothetical protein
LKDWLRRQLLIALVSYLFWLPLIYLFILWVFGFSEILAFACVVMAVVVTMPAIIIQTMRRSKQIAAAGARPADGAGGREGAKPLVLRLLLLAVGSAVAVGGTVGTLSEDGHALGWATLAAVGAAVVAAATKGMVQSLRAMGNR